MCLTMSNVRSAAPWNWDGDVIVHDPIIPASRVVPHTREKYEIDIREFISNRDNAVVKKTVRQIAEELSPDKRAYFRSHQSGSFDFRMQAITAFISEHIKYQAGSRKFDDWLFPEETLATGRGDCEDRAFLLASLLLSSGISGYVVRVALGKIYNQTSKKSCDHVWVMYKNEAGLWMLIEPLLFTSEAKEHTRRYLGKMREKATDGYEYIPYFIFNDAHMWGLKNNILSASFLDYLKSRSFWKEFDPKFAAGVHNHLFDEALQDMSWVDLLYIKGVSLALDINPAVYDPRDHFDNGYVAESWPGIRSNLEKKTLSGFAIACHSIADFYAHTSYSHFAKKDASGNLLPYDEAAGDSLFQDIPDYGSGSFDLHDESRFSINPSKCSESRDEAINFWNQKRIISGRFAQPGDPSQGLLEKVFVSIPYELRSSSDFIERTCLPHHNEIAVDDDLKDGNVPKGHKLYSDPAVYSKQFGLRRDAAISHIRKAYEFWKQ